MSLYKTEFPDFDDTLRIPKGFEDCSYHNDMMPHVERRFVRDDTGEVSICIWQDYVNPNKREDLGIGGYRFILTIEVNRDVIFEYKSNDWAEIEQMLKYVNPLTYNGWRKEV